MDTTQPVNTVHEIIRRVADVRDVEPTALPPLQATIDVDALNALLDDRFSGTCSFTYAGCDISISGSDSIQVRRHREEPIDWPPSAPRHPSID